MTTSEKGLASQSAAPEQKNSRLSQKIVGICIVGIFAVAIVFGGVHYTLEMIEASSQSGEYVKRLATEPRNDDPAVTALKYVCLFH